MAYEMRISDWSSDVCSSDLYQGDYRVLDQLRIVAGAEHEDSRFDDGTTTASTGTTSVYGELIVQPVRQLTVTGGVRNDDHDDFGSHTSVGANAALALATGTTTRASYAEGSAEHTTERQSLMRNSY